MTQQIDVRALRERVGWKREQLARYLGVDLSHISRIENGGRYSGPVRRLLETLTAASGDGERIVAWLERVEASTEARPSSTAPALPVSETIEAAE